MKQRIILLLTTVALLCVLFFPSSFSEVDYDTVYESAIKLAGNDLTNLDNVNDAVLMLAQTGSYSFTKSYQHHVFVKKQKTKQQTNKHKEK